MSKKKKSNKKQTSKSPSKKKPVKGLAKKKSVSKSAKSKKPVKSKKTSKKRAKSVSKKKAQSILSSKRWKTTRDSTGKLVKGRKKSKKLTRTQDKNRYQTIIKTLSDYYKKAGSPLKRTALYDEYRRIRDEFSNTPLTILIPQFETLVIKKKGTRTMPTPLILGIDWYVFEDVMTAPYSQQYFRSNDIIVLDLSCLGLPNMSFPYSKIIGSYNKLYNNYLFRTAVKNAHATQNYPMFKYDNINSDETGSPGTYIFVLVDCPPTAGVVSGKPKGKVSYQTPKGKTSTTDTTQTEVNIEGKLNDQLTSLMKQKEQINDMYIKDKISKAYFENEIINIEDAISEKQSEINNLKK